MNRSSSSGILAVLMGLVCVILSGCHRDQNTADYWRAEREKIELIQSLNLAEYQWEMFEPEVSAELEEITAVIEEQEECLAELARQKAGLVVEIHRLEDRNSQFKCQMILARRSSVLGREFDVITLKDGRVFRDISVRSVDDVGVTIRHEHGSARLHCFDLMPEHQEMFGLEEEWALAAQHRESRQSLAYETWIDNELEVIRRAENEASLLSVTVARNSISSSSRSSKSSGVRTQRRQATGLRSRDGDRSSRFRVQRPVYRYRYYYPLPQYRLLQRRDSYSCKPNLKPRFPVAPVKPMKQTTPFLSDSKLP